MLLGALVCAPSCHHRAVADEAAASAASSTVNTQVETQPVATREVPTWLSLTGQLKGKQAADLAANTDGKVIKTLVERGDVVKAGQPLVVLDTRAAALSFEEAKASAASASAVAENAQVNCERYRRLAKTGAISDAELDSYTVQCRTSDFSAAAARARAALAGKSLGDGIIRAPFSGAITERYVDVGQFVHPDSRIAGLVDLSTLRLEFTVPEARSAAVRAGAKVRFQVASRADKTFDGTVRYVSAQVRPGTRDLVAEAVVDSPSVELKPGMFTLLKLDVGTQTLPVVPSGAILERDGKKVVFIAADGKLEERIVLVGDASGNEMVVLRGVAPGDKLVVAPSDKLKNGQSVL